MPDVSVSREVAAPPEVVWGLVSDLPRMGEWSPENDGGKWIGDATGPTTGAKFRGDNHNGGHSWKTVATVTDCDSPSTFNFSIKAALLPIAEWGFEIEPTEQGCTIKQHWTDRRPGFFKPIAAKLTSVKDRATYNREAMTETLDRLAATAESAAA